MISTLALYFDGKYSDIRVNLQRKKIISGTCDIKFIMSVKLQAILYFYKLVHL